MKNTVIQGDCLEEMKSLPENSVDAIVTDPPYGLEFMGKDWDKGVPGVEFWVEMLRVLKPGGHLLSFSGTRTYHRMASAIEDAGFEVRDMIEWVYGSGFPKSLNIGKAVDKLQGNERESEIVKGKIFTGSNNNINGEAGEYEVTKGTSEWEGWGTALKPAHEPICMARKPLAEKTVAENVLKYGTGGINIDESRVGTEKISVHGYQGQGVYGVGGKASYTTKENGADTRPTYTEATGRFPANLILEDCEEVRECFPESTSGARKKGDHKEYDASSYKFGGLYSEDVPAESGNASRFFKSIIYQAKASKSERNKGCEKMEAKVFSDRNPELDSADMPQNRSGNAKQNFHPTVKPIALMEYLIKMVTPNGGIVLDPFMGSGSTGVACKNLNCSFIGIELDPSYIEIAKKRLTL